jgi:hypothetical protein
VPGKPSYRELTGKGSEAEQAEEARSYQLSWHDSVVEDVFVGQLQSTITCAACGGASHCFDPFYSLALPLPAKGGPVAVQVNTGSKHAGGRVPGPGGSHGGRHLNAAAAWQPRAAGDLGPGII